MKRPIIERVHNSKFVNRTSKPNGFDRRHGVNFVDYNYVIIDGKQQQVFDMWWLVIENNAVKEVLTEFQYKESKIIYDNQEKYGFDSKAEYDAYLKGIDEGLSPMYKGYIKRSPKTILICRIPRPKGTDLEFRYPKKKLSKETLSLAKFGAEIRYDIEKDIIEFLKEDGTYIR